MNERQTLGRWGESVAATHLEAKGYQIVTRNWRCQHGEVDLVARTGEEWVFVEVKTRRGRDMGAPEEALTPRKQQKLLAVAQEYILTQALDVDWRIDLIAVELDKAGKLLRCEHIPHAVLGW
ncbi:MAG: YraN family protein [Ardenticatenaceae bacterium]|nr:YraN family protein [Ardenticatenaceae bacterium]